MFYTAGMAAQYREEPCRSALNKVKGMPFGWSLNPYMGCVHRCTFCYVRAFERRADRPEQLREVVRAAREAGATGIWANLLFLRPGTREHFLEHLAEDWPEQLPLYERLYANRRAYLGDEERNPLREQIGALAREYGIRDRRNVKLAPPPQPEQLSLGF